MDSGHGISVEDERFRSEQYGGDGSADGNDVGQEFSSGGVGQNERRMQVRAYNHWASLLGTRNFPRIGDLDAARMASFAENAVVLDFSGGDENPAVTMLGRRLAAECGAVTTISRLDEIPDGSLLSRITSHYRQIWINQAPVGFEAEFINQRGRTVVYRGILLPFASDGETIQHIMGVINWKELADAHITAGLLHELNGEAGDSQTLAHEMPTASSLGEWADGPAAVGLANPSRTRSPGNNLAEWLDAARELADAAYDFEKLGRTALHAAIGRAWELASMAEAEPQAFQAMVVAAGLDVSALSPVTTSVALVFGAGYDPIRRSEFVLALQYARRRGLGTEALSDCLATTTGGVNGMVSQERALAEVRQITK